MAKSKQNSLLWRISKPDLPYVSYVFGTMHVKDKQVFRDIDFVEKTILECQSFAAEFNLDDLDQPLLDQYLTMEGLRLSQLLKPKYYAKLEKIVLEGTGIQLRFLDNKTPFFIISILTESLFQSEMPEALDRYLHEFAKTNEKQILGIEKFSEQIEVLKRLKLKIQLKSLISIIKNYKNFKRQHFKAAELYLKQDIKALYQSVKKSAKGTRKILIFDRNKVMADRIADFAATQSIFCAIGAGHLSGEKGVLRLLKQKGYKIRPIKIVAK
ncbi:MAG: TraB/GumN family protein [Bacteroidota bacterium]